MPLHRRAQAALIVAFTFVTASCGSDSTSPPPVPPPAVIGVTVNPKTSSSVTISFASTVGDASYDIERSEGASGSWAAVTSMPAPASGGPVTYTDVGLKANTAYRYHVFTNRGGLKSSASAEVNVTTLGFGNVTAVINGDITANRRLYADTAYTLSGFIHVANGATLTIDPGTIIKGDFNVLGSALMIMRGAKIQAVGTADAPIVFTSSRAAGQRQPGDWGGLLLVGNAINNRSGSVAVEGTGTDGNTVVGGKNYTVVYTGGNTPTDNSGTLSYVRVEFAGYAPVQDQEFNAFTFCAIGSGTRASYLEALDGLDDSFEFFGGGFDIDHLVAFETADDVLDMSEGFAGRIQFVVAQSTVQLTPRTNAGFYSVDPEGIENDGCQGPGCDLGFDSAPFTIPLVANFTIVGCGQATCMGTSGGHGMMLRRGTGGYYVNGVIARWTSDGVSMRDPETYKRAGSVAAPAAAADFQIRNVFFAETNNLIFQAPSATQFALDATANNLTLSTASTASLFVAIPAVGAAPAGISAFDFTPAANSPIATGGLSTFTGAILAKAGTFVTPTSYVGGVAPNGPKWFQGWTSYVRN